MGSHCLRLLTVICLLGIAAAAEINPGSSSILRDGNKGQPELHQPLDNNPYRWKVAEDENPLTNGEESYPEALTRKTMDLLSEAVNLLGRVRDVKSKQWLEVFVSKIGQLAVELEESTKNDDELSVARPTQYPIVPTASPLAQDATKWNKAAGKYHVTAPQLSDVLQNNEELMSRHVVTKPGIVSNDSEEDDLVKQLHEQPLEFKKKDPQIRVVVHHHLPKNMKTTTAPPTEEMASDSVQLDEKEKQLLLQLLQEMDEIPDFDNMERHQEKGPYSKLRNSADFDDSNKFSSQKQDEMDKGNEFELEEDIQSDPQEYNSYSEVDIHDLNLLLSSTDSPAALKPTDKPSVSISHDFPSQQQSEKHEQHPQLPNTLGIQHIPLQNQNFQGAAYQPSLLPYPMNEQTSSHHRPLSVHKNYLRQITKNYHPHPTQNVSFHKNEQTRNMQNAPHQNKFYHHLNTIENPQKHLKYPHEHSVLPNNFLSNPRQWESSKQQSNEKESRDIISEIYNHTYPQTIPIKNEPLNSKRILGIRSKNTRSHYHQQRLHSPNPFHQRIYAADANSLPFQPKNALLEHEARPKSTTNSMHSKHMPFQDHMESSIQLEDDLQRQLRAGKVVILSDSVVRTNFGKHPSKDKKTDDTVQSSITAHKKQNDQTEVHN